MAAILRSMGAIVVGALVCGVLIALIEALGHVIYPVPPDLDITDREAIAKHVATMPLGAFFPVLVAWFVGTFCGAWIAALVAGRAPYVHGLIIGVLFLVAGIANMLMIPHPAWFWVVGVLLFVPAAYLGASLVARRGSARSG